MSSQHLSPRRPLAALALAVSLLLAVVLTSQVGAGNTPVSILDFEFDPAMTTIQVGDTVEWTNDGAFIHTSTSTGNWDSGLLDPGENFSFTFNTPGTFNYFCTQHPFMTGTIMVQGGPTFPLFLPLVVRGL